MTAYIDRGRLGQISLFNGMSETQIDQIAQMMRLRKFRKDEIIIREGELGGELYVLLEGTIEISKRLTLHDGSGEDLRDKSLVRLSDTDNVFFGEMTMFGAEERSATVKALTETNLGVLTIEHVNLLSGKDPQIGHRLFYNIGRTMATNLRRANRDILKLTTAFCLALEGK